MYTDKLLSNTIYYCFHIIIIFNDAKVAESFLATTRCIWSDVEHPGVWVFSSRHWHSSKEALRGPVSWYYSMYHMMWNCLILKYFWVDNFSSPQWQVQLSIANISGQFRKTLHIHLLEYYLTIKREDFRY